MKIITANGKNQVKISRKEWEDIGKKQGWLTANKNISIDELSNWLSGLSWEKLIEVCRKDIHLSNIIAEGLANKSLTREKLLEEAINTFGVLDKFGKRAGRINIESQNIESQNIGSDWGNYDGAKLVTNIESAKAELAKYKKALSDARKDFSNAKDMLNESQKLIALYEKHYGDIDQWLIEAEQELQRRQS